MLQKIRTVCDLVLGLLILGITLWGYLPDPRYMGEYCFIAGMLIGGVFLASFLLTLTKKKRFPVWVYFDCMLSVQVIFIATVALGLNLEGAFWYIHILEPVLLFVYWCVFCDHREVQPQTLILTDLAFPAAYLLFAFILWQATGSCPFPAALLYIDRTWGEIVLGILAVGVIFTGLGFGLHALNRVIRSRLASKKQAA